MNLHNTKLSNARNKRNNINMIKIKIIIINQAN